MGDIALDPLLRRQPGRRGEAVFRPRMPVQLHSHAPDPPVLAEHIELWPNVGALEIRVRHDRVRPAGPLGGILDPPDFLLELLRWPIRLDIDRLRHPARGGLGTVLLYRVVASYRPVRPEDAGLHRAGQPRKVRLSPDVEMAVDQGAHPLASSAHTRAAGLDLAALRPISFRMACGELPSERSSR